VLVTGTGISEIINVLPDFKRETRLAISWEQAADGNWVAVDRGAAYDVYEATISIYGTETYINTTLSEIEANRAAASNVVALTEFGTDETIFGDDIDYTSVSATFLSARRRRQGTWKGWGAELRLRALAPTFSGTASFPTLRWCDVGIDGDGDLTINKIDSYTGIYDYLDHSADYGTFTGVFTLSRADTKSLRRYIATRRTLDFELANTFGISYPFGIRSAGTYPYTCKLIGWEDLGPWGIQWNRIRLKFAEAVGLYTTGLNDYQDTDGTATIWQDTDGTAIIYQM